MEWFNISSSSSSDDDGMLIIVIVSSNLNFLAAVREHLAEISSAATVAQSRGRVQCVYESS